MAKKELTIPEMKTMARKLRRHILTMIGKANSGHPGGSLSSVEIVTALYFKVLRHDPADAKWPQRDRFVLSKGHGAPVLYAALAECGYLELDQLSTLRQIDSCLQGHTDCHLTSGVEMSAGSLGQGLSFAVGTALAARLDGLDYKVYTLLGDGECDEGQVWEAAAAAAHFKTDNLIAIVDKNGIQLDGWTKDIMNMEPFADKWRSFGFKVFEVDGHDIAGLVDVLEAVRKVKGQPSAIIANTVKGKGVSFMENNPDFHGKAPTPPELEKALQEVA
jgi:transketolase